MNTQPVWGSPTTRHKASSVSQPNIASHTLSVHDSTPWDSPRTVEQAVDRDNYNSLKDRLAAIPTRSKQKRQALYLDLWTGQHWLGVKLSCPEESEILKPVSVDTALSVATVGTYRLLNQPLFADSQDSFHRTVSKG